MRLIFSFLIVILLTNCKKNEQIDEIVPDQNIETKNERETVIEEKNNLENFNYEDVARYTIASLMGQPTKKIKVIKNKDLFFVSYIRKSDKQKFEYKVTFQGNNILWANIDGRWMNSEYDEKLSFEEIDEILNIITTYNDGSQDIQKYKKGE